MYFENKAKLTFGPVDENPEIFAGKLQAISNLSLGSFESNIYGDSEEEESYFWMLSDFFDRK